MSEHDHIGEFSKGFDGLLRETQNTPRVHSVELRTHVKPRLCQYVVSM